MSPEQVEGAPLTPAGDVFALGGVLAFAATGSPPFGHVTVPALLYRVLTADPDLRRVPPGLRPLVAACLAKDSARRPTPEQILEWIGPLEPAHDWLPAPVHRMVDERTAQARTLAGAPAPEPVTEALPLPAPRARSHWWVAGGIGLAAALVAALAFAPPGRGTSADEAATLVAELLPRTPPAGFLVYDNPATPEVDGAATDPRKIGHTASYFACDVQADPPTPAESGIVAVSGIVFEEGVETLPRRVREHRTITVAYLDDTARTRIGQEVRERIGDCRTEVPAAFTALRFSLTEIPAADETVGYTFELPPVRGLSQTPPQIGSCEIARVDAVVVRACALISNNRQPQDTALAGITRGMLEPVLQQARALQE